MLLNRLVLRNFKGVKDFVLEPNGKDINVYGENHSGKTTLFDSFYWLLFDKDSDSKQRSPKTVDSEGNSMHLEAEVEAVLSTSDTKATLRKTYKERMTKRKGDAHATFTGHDVGYFIDDVPKSAGEFNAHVSGLIDEDLFKLLANPHHFNEVMKWEKRREILVSMCGDISNEDVVASNPALSLLPAIIEGRSIEDHKKVLAAQKAKINAELKELPARIDEAERTKPAAIEGDIDAEIERLKASHSKAEQDVAKLKSGGLLGEKKAELINVNADILKESYKQEGATDNKARDIRKQSSDLLMHTHTFENTLKNKQEDIETVKTRVSRAETTMQELRVKYTEIQSSKYNPVCPTCGQDLPEGKKDEGSFNLDKSRKLELIKAEGLKLKTFAEGLKADSERLQDAVLELKRLIAENKADIAALEEEVQHVEDVRIDTTEFDRLTLLKTDLENEIAELEEDNSNAIHRIQQNIAEIDEVWHEKNLIKAGIEQAKNTDIRIRELKDRERKLAGDFEEIEAELYQAELFERTKINMLEEKINGMFKMAKFKMFDQQINEGIKATCKTLLNGVSYDDLSNSEQINVGLDIIDTLSKHYNITSPIFLDNAEAVTDLLPTIGQQIRLYVSAGDSTLRVEG